MTIRAVLFCSVCGARAHQRRASQPVGEEIRGGEWIKIYSGAWAEHEAAIRSALEFARDRAERKAAPANPR